MSDRTDEELEPGGRMLAQLSNEMVRVMKRFFGKGPTSAKSYMLDDLLIVVMRGGMTTAEQTMKDFDQEDRVREFRQVFENEMTDHLTARVEEITGRKVVTYQSQIMFDPDLIVEMFVFDDKAPEESRVATGRGQANDDGTGEATDADALDEPSEGGQ
ncbi:MAG: DUF2294 domain-containing protein [Actinomycetota bacterium]|nr:DUF2294 domain-containing protein [Actinomycetota bacterium]